MATKNGKRNGENIAAAVTEVSERVSLLVREELELAKAEVTQKVTSIAKGAVAVAAAGIFGVFALVYALLAVAWGINSPVAGAGKIWVGFAAVFGGLLLLAIGTFLFAWRKLRVGAPTPDMAIAEAKKTREMIRSNGTEPVYTMAGSVGVVAPAEPSPPAEAEETVPLAEPVEPAEPVPAPEPVATEEPVSEEPTAVEPAEQA